MFGADMSMLQAIALFMSVLQDFLGFGSQREFNRSRDFFSQEGATFNFFANRFDGQLGPGKKTPGERLIFTHQSQ